MLAAPLAFAQPAQKVRRIGYLSLEAAESEPGRRNQRMIRESLRRAGYEEGRNLAVEWRFAEERPDRLEEFAKELVRADVELIVTLATPPTLAARRASRTVPIVMYFGVLPVEVGVVESLARPGGNVTGTTWTSPELPGKLLQILKDAAPGAVRIAVIRNPALKTEQVYASMRDSAAQALGMTLQYFDIPGPDDVPAALKRIAASRPDALQIHYDPGFGTRLRDIAGFAVEHKLVSIGNARSVVNSGALLYYGPNTADIVDQTAVYVDRILRGAKPAGLPVQLPRKYELVINMNTARAIGYKVPPALATRVDEVIE